MLMAATAQGAEDGAAIYQEGRSAEASIEAHLADGKTVLPATAIPCASCHGTGGAGKSEGGNLVPPVTWGTLTAPRAASSEQPARPAYHADGVARAIREGVDAAGRPLSRAMPRYALSAPQIAVLLDYLKELGRDEQGGIGVSPDVIRLGTALPLSGPRAAVGQGVKRVLDAVLQRASASGIYGRRVELVVADSALRGADVAVKQLTETERVFALVATQLPDDVRDLDPGEPVIGVLEGSGPLPLPRVFRIASPVEDRIIVLLRQLVHCNATPPRIAVIGSSDAADGAVLDSLAYAKAKVVVNWHDPARPEAAIAAAAKAGVDAVLLLGRRETAAAVGTAMTAQNLSLPLLVPGQPGEDIVAGAIAGRAFAGMSFVRWAFAGLVPTQVDTTDFVGALSPAVTEAEPSLLEYEAYGSAIILVAALRQTGRRLDRAGLVAALENLRDVRTGVLPPMGFAPGRHDGIAGAAVVGFGEDGRPIFLSDWQRAETFAPAPGCRG
ncbi:MAG TPA: ABC transporter substrate-binding protein [Stellaceae bacterium]|nr:ABC transporter substrate-binding protein [Stellaceae bacterium]